MRDLLKMLLGMALLSVPLGLALYEQDRARQLGHCSCPAGGPSHCFCRQGACECGKGCACSAASDCNLALVREPASRCCCEELLPCACQHGSCECAASVSRGPKAANPCRCGECRASACPRAKEVRKP